MARATEMLSKAPGESRPDDTDERTLAEIGQTLRNARMTKRMRLKDVADRVGCSVSMLSKIENGRAAPSLRILHSVVRVLDTSIAALFSSAPDGDLVFFREGERPTVMVDGTGRSEIILERLVPFAPDRVLEGNIHIVLPGADSGGAISHVGEEVGLVIEGTVELRVGATTRILRQGDSFFFKSELPHSYRNVGDVVAKIVWINTPPTF
jgi:transcriptional regulator with XRE-family HTH domain